MTFGALAIPVRLLRKTRGLSQVELAARAGITQAAVSEIERGGRLPTLRTLGRLSQALDVAPAMLLESSERSSPSREATDRIARAILRGQRALPPDEQRLADAVGSLVIQKLRAHAAPGVRRYSRGRWEAPWRPIWVRRTYGERTVSQLLRRLEVLLAIGAF